MSPGREKCHRCGGSGKEPDWQALGGRMRAERVRRGMSLRQAAVLVYASPSYISMLERYTYSWQGNVARRYLKLLGVTP